MVPYVGVEEPWSVVYRSLTRCRYRSLTRCRYVDLESTLDGRVADAAAPVARRRTGGPEAHPCAGTHRSQLVDDMSFVCDSRLSRLCSLGAPGLRPGAPGGRARAIAVPRPA